MDNKTEAIVRIREFNRFFTALFGVLDNNYLKTEYSATEARVLFELNNNDGCNANFLIHRLSIDKGYLSRIIKKFSANGLLSRKICKTDARAYDLSLTEKGKKTACELIEKSNAQISLLLTELSLEECKRVCEAMDLIKKFLSGNSK